MTYITHLSKENMLRNVVFLVVGSDTEMIVLICTRKHTTIPYKAASKFLDQRKGREGNEEREGGGGLFVEEMERGEGGNVVK